MLLIWSRPLIADDRHEWKLNPPGEHAQVMYHEAHCCEEMSFIRGSRYPHW
jgi:hypothetical protein